MGGFMKEFRWMAMAILFGIVWISLRTASEKADPVRREQMAVVEAATQSVEHRARITELEERSLIYPPACYIDQIDHEARRAVLRPEIWIGMTEDARARFDSISLLSVSENGGCVQVPVIDGIVSRRVSVPYVSLYETYLRAMSAGDVERIQLLQFEFWPVTVSATEFPSLLNLTPDSVDGGLDGYETMQKLFEVRDYRFSMSDSLDALKSGFKLIPDDRLRGSEIGHVIIYKAMGGSVRMTCDRRPESKPGRARIYSPAAYVTYGFMYEDVLDRSGTYVVVSGCSISQ